MMKRIHRFAALAAVSSLLAGCTSGNSAIEPPFQSVNPLTYKLTFVVGTANYTLPASGMVVTGLNTVVAYRQPNGLSGTLVNSPTITGPTGFTVPSVPDAGSDAGTNKISSDSQSLPAGTSTTTFGQAGGAFAYGFLPLNSTNNAEAGNNGYTPYTNPIYGNSISGTPGDQVTFLGGPPAYTNVRTGTFPTGFNGFTMGFDSFAGTTLATGTYTLSLVVPTSPTKSGTLTASANLSKATTLPAYAAPTFTEDGAGGGTAALTVPAGVLETIVEVVDLGGGACLTKSTQAPPYYYSVVDHTAGPATATVSLPDNVGPPPTSGGTNPTLCTGDSYTVTALGFDYAAYESGPGQPNPNGSSSTPSFFLPGGPSQADVTVSPPLGVAAYAKLRRPYLKIGNHRFVHR